MTAAVAATVGEIGAHGEREADRVANQINKAFGKRDPVALPPRQATLLEALQAGIAGQLSVVDDAGRPAADLVVGLALVRPVGTVGRQITPSGGGCFPASGRAVELAELDLLLPGESERQGG